MNKLFLCITIMVMSGLAFGQQIRTIKQDDLANSKLKLSQDWRLTIENQKVAIKNGRISNASSQPSGKMNLELFFSPAPLDLNSEKINGYPVSSFEISGTGGNSALAGVNILFETKQIPPDGNYFPVLILTQSGVIKDVFQMKNSNILVQNHTLTLFQPSIKNETNFSGVTDPNIPIQMVMLNDSGVTLDDDWKIEIDFKNYMVTLTGGDINNRSSKDIKHLKIDVFLTKEKLSDISQNFDGLQIASIPFNEPIFARSKFSGTKINTNLRAIPPAGPQYILMTVSEVGEDGKTYVKSIRTFEDPFTAY